MNYFHFLDGLLLEFDGHVQVTVVGCLGVAGDIGAPDLVDVRAWSQRGRRCTERLAYLFEYERDADDNEDYDSGALERSLESKRPVLQDVIRLFAEHAVGVLALAFELARRARVDLPYRCSQTGEVERTLDCLFGEAFPGETENGWHHSRGPVRGLDDAGLKALLRSIAGVLIFARGLLAEIARRSGLPRPAVLGREHHWRLYTEVESHLVDRPGSWLWLGREAEQEPAPTRRSLDHATLRTLLDELIDLVEADAALGFEIADRAVDRFGSRAAQERDRLRAASSGFSGFDLVEVELGQARRHHGAADHMRRCLGRTYPSHRFGRPRFRSRWLEILLWGLVDKPRHNFGLAIALASAVKVPTPYEKRMLNAWSCVHQRLVRRAFCYRLDELGGGRRNRPVDARWLEKLLRMLIDAAQFAHVLTLDVARRAGVELPRELRKGVASPRALARLLQEAIPPVA